MKGRSESVFWTAGIILLLLGALIGLVQSGLSNIDKEGYPQAIKDTTIVKETVEEEETLQMVIITHRHGDRTPIFYEEDELELVPWPQGYGQLTSTGISQLYHLGLSLREFFVNDFIPEKYTADIISVRASDTDRTLQSAFSLLTGIYGPGSGPTYPFEYAPSDQVDSLPNGIQPVPIHTVDPHTDYLLRSFDNCGKYQEYLKNDVFTSQSAVDLAQENADLFSLLSTTFDMDISLSNLNMAYDVLYCEHAHGYWGLRGIDNDTYDRVVALENKVFSYYEFAPSDKAYLIGGPLIGSFMENIESHINNSKSTKVYHYSGHDVSLGSLLAALGYQLEEVPNYASHVITELHLIDDLYYLRFFYNFLPIVIPSCQSISDPFLCPYSLFKSSFEGKVPKNAAEECEIEMAPPPIGPPTGTTPPTGDDDPSNGDDDGNSIWNNYWTFFILGFIGCALIIAILAASAYYGYKRYRNRQSLSSSGDDDEGDLTPSYELDEIESSKPQSHRHSDDGEEDDDDDDDLPSDDV